MWTLVFTIIGINVAYVSIFTLRMIFVIKGKKLLASGLSMVEVFIYLMGLTIVLDNLDNPINVAAYCLGFGIGVLLGGKVEEWLALGYATVQVIIDEFQADLPVKLRELGYGVTSWLADGKDGRRLVMQVLVKRSNEAQLYRHLELLAPKAFVISYEPKSFKGGFWVKRIR
ncbi:DUF2179 domain-containing protein [Paenibacillus turpanensis]|uniref:DUF2179 domain-containing protein n=1 Tax=Paenibacillus turpanensis TaxID=2689078 RepID=UPI00140C3692|nr:DUF2179 domain-containing protein [Paenibacillus turpanensis]